MAITIEAIREELKKVPDPELNLNIVDLGLIYHIAVDEKKNKVTIVMTMTFPGCPLGPYFEREVPAAARKVEGVEDVELQITFDPPWKPTMVTEEAKEELRMRGVPV